jgi:hypothetical protein
MAVVIISSSSFQLPTISIILIPFHTIEIFMHLLPFQILLDIWCRKSGQKINRILQIINYTSSFGKTKVGHVRDNQTGIFIYLH